MVRRGGNLGGMAQKYYTEKAQKYFFILVIVVFLISLIACGLFVVRTYFLPQLQKHHNHNKSHLHLASASTKEEGHRLDNGTAPNGAALDPKSSRAGESDEDSSDLVMIVIIGVAALLSSLPIPTLYTVTCVGSGFALGFQQALLVVVPLIAVGIAVMFTLSRRWLHDVTSNWIKKSYPAMYRLCHSAASRGPIIIMRFTPIPFAIQTMLWGSCSPVEFRTFFPATLFVVVPQIAMFAWFGASTTNLAQALNTRNPLEVVLLVTFALVCLLGYSRLSAWAKAQMEETQANLPDSPKRVSDIV